MKNHPREKMEALTPIADSPRIYSPPAIDPKVRLSGRLAIPMIKTPSDLTIHQQGNKTYELVPPRE